MRDILILLSRISLSLIMLTLFLLQTKVRPLTFSVWRVIFLLEEPSSNSDLSEIFVDWALVFVVFFGVTGFGAVSLVGAEVDTRVGEEGFELVVVSTLLPFPP